jgi:hypothetical protein
VTAGVAADMVVDEGNREDERPAAERLCTFDRMRATGAHDPSIRRDPDGAAITRVVPRSNFRALAAA